MLLEMKQKSRSQKTEQEQAAECDLTDLTVAEKRSQKKAWSAMSPRGKGRQKDKDKNKGILRDAAAQRS